MYVCMCVHLVVALPLEATDGPYLLSSQGRRQHRVVLIMLASPKGCVFCFTHAIIPVQSLEKLILAEPLLMSTYQIVALMIWEQSSLFCA